MSPRSLVTRYVGPAALALLAGVAPVWAEEIASTGDEVAQYVYDESGGDSFVRPVAMEMLQQPGDGMSMAPAAGQPRSATPTRRGPSGSRQGNIRLASVPNMFGDVFLSSGRVFTDAVNSPNGTPSLFAGGFELPAAGGSRRAAGLSDRILSVPVHVRAGC